MVFKPNLNLLVKIGGFAAIFARSGSPPKHTYVKATKIAQGQFWTVFFYQLRLIAVNEAYTIKFVAKF